MAYRTKDFYTGDGVSTLYPFTFPYINENDIRVKLDNVILAKTEYTLANATTINFTTPPGYGVGIEIYRETQLDTPVNTFYPGSAIRARDLNDNYTQTLFITQESIDGSNNSFENSELALAKAEEALSTANSAKETADIALDTANGVDAKASQAQSDAAQALLVAQTAVPLDINSLPALP